MLLNIDKIPYVCNRSLIEIRERHTIAENIESYLSDIDAYYVEFFCGRCLDKTYSKIKAHLKPSILSDIQSGKLFLILHNIHEAFYDIGKSIIAFCEHFEIPGSQVIVITGNHGLYEFMKPLCDKKNFVTPRIISCDVFEIQAVNQLDYLIKHNLNDWISLHPLRKNHTHRYLNLNRRWRDHRTMFVTALIAHDMLRYGKVSFGMADDNNYLRANEIIESASELWPTHTEIQDKITENVPNILNTLPLYLDTEDLVTNRAMPEKEDYELYTTTGISVVSETTFYGCVRLKDHAQPGVFLSEKAFKPVMHLHPWIMISQPYTQQVMKLKGYETFSELWDESYDYETNDEHRMYMILKLLSKIISWDADKYTDTMLRAHEICLRNIHTLYDKHTNTEKYFRELNNATTSF